MVWKQIDTMFWDARKNARILPWRLQFWLATVILAAEEEVFLGSEPVS